MRYKKSGKICIHPFSVSGIEPKTFMLWANDAHSHCNTVPGQTLFSLYFYPHGFPQTSSFHTEGFLFKVVLI